jgi:hypothetical protein
MTATQLPPTVKSTLEAVREGLVDIRDRVSDIEALPDWDKLSMPEWDKLSMPDWDKLAENTQGLIDRATGRQRRRPAWPLVAFGVLAVVAIAAGVPMYVMNRGSVDQLADELESDVDQPWTPAKAAADKATRTEFDTTAASFPASDPMPSPMSPSLGS